MSFKLFKITLISLLLGNSQIAVNATELNSQSQSSDKQVLLAKAAKKKKTKRTRKVKEKHIVREKTYKGSDKKNLDFDAIDISGERKTPFGSIVNQNKASKDFDLIKIRLRWHPEMIQSTSSLETGRSR